ncbi:MAG: PBP1A family penicillin-binding protein [Myxococcota bacterium]
MAGQTRSGRPSALRPRRPVGPLRGHRPAKRRWLRRLFKLVVLLVVLAFTSAAGVLWYYGRDLPDVASLRDYAPPQTTRILDRDGEAIGEVFSERRTVIPMEQVPRHFVLSVLAAEDADFYRHEGLDYPGMARALLYDLIQGRAAQGASTITQQVVKLLLLTPERTFTRKIRELILARRLEQELTKDEILHLYINHINFGHARYGVQEAAQFYFGKDASDLTLAESSLIAGIPQAPARLSPRTHLDAAQRRQNYVLGQLEAKREDYWPDLTLEEIEQARETEPALQRRSALGESAPEIKRVVREMLRELVGAEAYRRGGYTVETTLDASIQRAARQALQVGLRSLDQRQRYRGPLRRGESARTIETLRVGGRYTGVVRGVDEGTGWIRFDVGGHDVLVEVGEGDRYSGDLNLARFAPVGTSARLVIRRIEETRTEAELDLGPQGAVVVIDPRTRNVLAIAGGYRASPGFDRATQASRQPGSTFKPLVYAVGIRSEAFTPATIMLDAPAVYDQWMPQNYEPWNHEGPVTLRRALARSINSVAVRAIEEVGPEEVVRFAQQLGIESELDAQLPLAFGASAVTPIEMVNAYATFAAGGRWAPPRFVTRIVGPDGEEVPLPTAEAPRDVMSPAEAYVVTSMMESVFEEGTARRARLGRPAAGKTGTSNGARDAWFVGYTANFAAGVWVGFDDNRPLGRREGGSRSALPIWVEVIQAAEGNTAVTDFARPSGVVTRLIDPATGLLAYEGLAGARDEVFVAGTEPTETVRPPDVLDSNSFLMEELGGSP